MHFVNQLFSFHTMCTTVYYGLQLLNLRYSRFSCQVSSPNRRASRQDISEQLCGVPDEI